MSASEDTVSVNHASIGLLNSLQNNGLDGLLKNFIHISNKESSNSLFASKNSAALNELAETKYYNSWKLGLWEESPESSAASLLNEETGFNQTFHSGYFFENDKFN